MIAETKMDLKLEPAQCEDAQEELAQLLRWVTQAAQRAAAFDEVERHLFRKMLEIGRHMVDRFLALTGPGDLGAPVALEGSSVDGFSLFAGEVKGWALRKGRLYSPELMGDSAKLQVKVVPGASRTRVAGRYGEGIKVQVAAAPEKGKANEAVIAVLAKWLGVRAGQVTITSGHTQARKQVRIDGVTAEQLAERLKAME